ncbi:unnamed protein product [Allacma fusca]|uniref:Uncharacterized protein n=1 Tax=Allacma fusca TaxID=39272 RepID=A0A8J2JBJ3_9HEXA|nr:unnamed protein product [Allacma fusca]
MNQEIGLWSERRRMSNFTPLTSHVALRNTAREDNVLTASSASVIPRDSPTNTTVTLQICRNETLNDCWRQLPAFSENGFDGIPSSLTGINTSCEAFATGMRCVHNWTNRCMAETARQKIMESVRGAQEAFSFLCKDQKFQSDFLKHKECYKKISPRWDACAKGFLNNVRSVNPGHQDNSTHLCCLRTTFRRCVSEVLHHFCSKEASLFLMRMAETLVKNNMKGKQPQPEICDSAKLLEECEKGDGAAWIYGQTTGILLPVFLILMVASRHLVSLQNF